MRWQGSVGFRHGVPCSASAKAGHVLKELRLLRADIGDFRADLRLLSVPHEDVGRQAMQYTIDGTWSNAGWVSPPPTFSALDFLWLELTNQCNLQCVHCYTESHPKSGASDRLTPEDYEYVMESAHDLGCRKLQFIGGEPQLNRSFLPLLKKAKTIGFDFIEVFTNLTKLDDATLGFAAESGVCFATSVYSDQPMAHDAITKVKSSHDRTIRNLERLQRAGVETRAAIIIIDQNAASVERTKRFLKQLGVRHIRAASTREFGRGQQIVARSAQLSGLCGHCWAGKLCVAPDGVAYPCVMARHWPVGNVLECTLPEIVRGAPLRMMRQSIFDKVWQLKTSATANGKCGGTTRDHSGDCSPNSEPHQPAKEPPGAEPPDPEEPSEACPETCTPDWSTCGPISCPQSCEPNPVTCGPDIGDM